jgi:hypothetical protein
LAGRLRTVLRQNNFRNFSDYYDYMIRVSKDTTNKLYCQLYLENLTQYLFPSPMMTF